MSTIYKTPYGDDFNRAFSWVMEVEGIVCTNDPDDPGGLTVCGISKVYQPQWSGWKEIDAGLSSGKIKLKKNLPVDYIANVVSEFYYTNIWKKYMCDQVPGIIGSEIFDQAINPGPKVMTKNLQTVLNTLNYNTTTKKTNDTDLVIDGLWGKNTRTRLMSYIKDNAEFIALSMNCLQGDYYLSLATNNVLKRKYIRGWLLRRINIEK